MARRAVALQAAWEEVRMAAAPWVAAIREVMAEGAFSTALGKRVAPVLAKEYPDG
jgi:hypothetical protein